jgi:AcrR family transcriptional regulator
MPEPGKGGRYHHGNLRAALLDTAIELIGEHGLRGFSLTQASRRLGVAVSAPYAHFADRDDLLAAVAVRAFEQVQAEMVAGTERFTEPADRLAAMTRAYVLFAANNWPLFEVMYEARLDKTRHPEVGAAERPIDEAFQACVTALTGDEAAPEDLAIALEATAHGYVRLLIEDVTPLDAEAVERAAERAVRATMALIESRHLLSWPAARPAGGG